MVIQDQEQVTPLDFNLVMVTDQWKADIFQSQAEKHPQLPLPQRQLVTRSLHKEVLSSASSITEKLNSRHTFNPSNEKADMASQPRETRELQFSERTPHKK